MSSKKLNILIINSARKWIGEAARCVSLTEGLIRRGHRVVLVCRKGYALEQLARERKIPHAALHMTGKFTVVLDVLDLLKLRRIILENRIDVVHCHRGKDHWLSAATLRFIGERRRPILVRTRHVVTPVKNHCFNRWLYRSLTDRVIAVSKKAGESLRDMPLENAPGIVYASVDSRKFSPEMRSDKMRAELGAKGEAPLIGLVGRLQRIKGQRVFLNAAAEIKKEFPEARFVLAGKGSERRREGVRRIARECGVDDALTLLGYLDDAAALIASLDAGILASLGSEGSSRIVLEYMASGTPVVATRVGGVQELLDNGKYGLLVDPGDAGALADAVIRILNDKAGAARRKAAALDRARRYFSEDRFLDETLDFYRRSRETKSTL